MNTFEKNSLNKYFLFIQRYGTSYNEGTATLPYLSYFCKKKKKIRFSSFPNILNFLKYFHNFLTIYSKHTTTQLRSADIKAFWLQAAMPAAAAIFILVPRRDHLPSLSPLYDTTRGTKMNKISIINELSYRK